MDVLLEKGNSLYTGVNLILHVFDGLWFARRAPAETTIEVNRRNDGNSIAGAQLAACRQGTRVWIQRDVVAEMHEAALYVQCAGKSGGQDREEP